VNRAVSTLPLAAIFFGGCALLEKAEPLDVTYFDPSPATIREQAIAGATSERGSIELRLDRVTAAEHLRERIAYRRRGVEIGFYEDQRWAEQPDTYVRRALAHALFDEQGFGEAVSGARPALEAELIAFEEVRSPRGKGARVSIRYALRDGARVVASDLITIERPLDGGGQPIDLARALGDALGAASTEIGKRTAAALETPEPGDVP